MSEPIWIPLATVPPEIPTPVIEGRFLKGGVGGAMSWEEPAGAGLVTPDADWKYLGTDVSFVNGWGNYAAPYGPARFRKLASGLVVCEGLIQSGSVGTNAFTFPVGYRPKAPGGGSARTLIFQLAVGGSVSYEAARIDGVDGGFVPTAGAATTWISLTGVIFWTG